MIRLSLLLLTPFLAGCGLEEIFSPGSSKARHEYRQAGLIQTPTAPEAPLVSEVGVTPALDLPSPLPTEPEVVVEVPYIPPEPAPECVYDLFMIYSCIGGRIVLL